MANASCIGSDLYGLLVRHPWRPGAYVVGSGTEGMMKVVTESGEISRVRDDALVGLRALAVNPTLVTWGSEETTMGVGVRGAVSAIRTSPQDPSRQISNSLRADDSHYVCSSLQWNVHAQSLLAASFQPLTANIEPLKKCVKIFDLTAPSLLSPHTELPSECCYCLTWCTPQALVCSLLEGIGVCDIRQKEKNEMSTDKTPLYHLAMSPTEANIFAGIRVTPRGHVLELHDMRSLEKGALLRAPSKHTIGSLAWHATGNIVTAAVQTNIVETWDATIVLNRVKENAVNDVGYESDYEHRNSTPISLERRPSKKGGSALSLRGKEKRVGQDIVAVCWASDAAVDSQLILLTGAGEVVPHNTQQRTSMAVAPCGVVAQAAPEMIPQVLYCPDYTDIATAMKVREAKGIGKTRHTTYRVAKECNDVPLQQWAYWTWVMRRAEEHTKGRLTCPSFLDIMKSVEVTAKLTTATEQERKERGDSDAAKEEGAAAVSSKGHHAVLERQFKVFDSEWRRFLQVLCGWNGAPDMPGDVEVPVMCAVSKVAEFERTVANKLLHLRLTEAEELLRTYSGGGSNVPAYSLLAFALSGLTTESSVSWSNTVATLAASGLTLYLTTALQFLSSWSTGKDDSDGVPWARYADLLDCPSIDVLYKLGFACRYLSDDALEKYVHHVLASGSVHPLIKVLLNGVSETVLSEYLDRSGDIQVTALTATMFLNYQSDTCQRWVKSYREFLQMGGTEFARCRAEGVLANLLSDKTQQAQSSSATVQPKVPYPGGLRTVGMDPRKMLRLQRQLSQMRPAKSSADRTAAKEDKKQSPFLQLVCKYCGAVMSVGASKPAVCVKCCNPLPKCSVCVKTLGLNGDVASHQVTWCLSCAHGGHVDHLVDWFSVHDTCPVAGCECPCASLD